jgi:hypothetical protein
MTFEQALVFAERTSYLGVPGHLVTITSAAEDEFVFNLYGYHVIWIGATDLLVPGKFAWVAGPEKGTVFSYTNWAKGEPNNFLGSGEHCVQFSENLKQWNDQPCHFNLSFVIEYECPAGQVFTPTGCNGMIHSIIVLRLVADSFA